MEIKPDYSTNPSSKMGGRKETKEADHDALHALSNLVSEWWNRSRIHKENRHE